MINFFKKKKVSEDTKPPNIIIDTGEDILSVSPRLMKKNEETSDFVFVGNHKDLGCYGLLNIYNLERYKALCCSFCGLRIKIPVEITTAEELKEFLEKKNNEIN